VFVTGRDWLLKSAELDGHFPVYRDVIPESQSKSVADREDLVETLTEVAMATNEEARGVRVDLTPDSVRLTARAPELGESSGAVEAVFAGGGDDRIVTEFNPPFLLDALKTLSGDRVVIDVGQNMLDRTSNTVRSRPALLYAADSQRVRWVIMPINTGLEPSRETLGSNFEGEEAVVSSTTASPRTEPQQDADSSAQSARQRRKVTHVWPEIGTRLEGEFHGQTHAALVIAAPKLKSGRAVQVITGPASGQTFRSMTAAMEAATAHQRRQLGLGKSKKGLPASGWDFWSQVESKRMSA